MGEELENEQFEVRDLRDKDQYKVDDKFLNGYARFIEIYAVGVYNSLCRHAQFKSQQAFPSAKKIAEELNISPPKVFYSIWVLEVFNIIKRNRIGKKCNNRYDLLHKKHWKFVEKVKTEIESDVNKVNNGDVNVVNITYKQHLHHILTQLTSIVRITKSKDNKEKGMQGKALQSSNKKEINSLIDLFQEVNPSYERLFENKTQRASLERLVKKFGQEKVSNMIKGLKEIFGKPYAPSITTPYLLELKLADYINYLKKRSATKIDFIDFTKL